MLNRASEAVREKRYTLSIWPATAVRLCSTCGCLASITERSRCGSLPFAEATGPNQVVSSFFPFAFVIVTACISEMFEAGDKLNHPIACLF